jgi:serine protease Do
MEQSESMEREHLSLTIVLAVCVVLTGGPVSANEHTTIPTDLLQRASGSIGTLVQQISPSVVQIAVTGYRPVAGSNGEMALARARTIGSGVIVDSGGYILTNAHVVEGADRIDVILTGDGLTNRATMRTVKATLVGVTDELDLALLLVPIEGLRAVHIADSTNIQQGELVFAFGSPDGLRNSVSMGMVSALSRQVDENSPIPYVQTDAAINPGNSGGPLVDISGDLVGINTFIRSESGGSEGLGFALPSALVALAFPQLRDYGHLHRAVTGLSVQNVTPELVAGLGLGTDSGLIVSNVATGSPAEGAGIRVGDVLTAVDGRRIDSYSLADFYLQTMSLHDGQVLDVALNRDGTVTSARLSAVAVPHDCTREATLGSSPGQFVELLGVLVTAIPDDQAETRHDPGVLVTARVATPSFDDAGLMPGDVVRSINRAVVTTVDGLRSSVERIAPGGPVVLQVERDGRLTFIAFTRE